MATSLCARKYLSLGANKQLELVEFKLLLLYRFKIVRLRLSFKSWSKLLLAAMVKL
jgi:hypothetical protein